MPDTRDWLALAGGIVFVAIALWFAFEFVCPTDHWLTFPVRWLLVC